jgi:hypothetical protein
MRYRLACVLLPSVFLAASQSHGESNTQQITRDAFGCQSREDFEQIVLLSAADGDNEAAAKALLSGITSGRCVLLKIGQRVYLKDVKPLWERVQVRPQGETASYWTTSRVLRP